MARLWEIREGYDPDKMRHGYRFDDEDGDEEIEKAYEEGYHDGYECAMDDMKEKSHHGYRMPMYRKDMRDYEDDGRADYRRRRDARGRYM